MKLEFEPRKSGETAREFSYNVIRKNIANLNLEPGCALNDMEIAVRLGVSRTPVREAINQLKGESEIIEIYPQRGMKVALIDPHVIRNVRLMRMLIEKEMVRKCCVKASSSDIRWMERNIELQHFYLEHREMQKTVELDNELHEKFYTIAGYDYIYRSTRGSMIHYDRVRMLEAFYASYLDSIADHTKMVRAIEGNCPAEACRLIEVHLDRGILNEEKLWKEYPQYFKKEGLEDEGSQDYKARRASGS